MIDEHPTWAIELSDKKLAARIAKQQPKADREADENGVLGPRLEREQLAVLKWETARRSC